MTFGAESEGEAPRRAPSSFLACASCGSPVDPLRAERVAFIRERFRYFCSVQCRQGFNAEQLRTPLPRTPEPDRVSTPTPRSDTTLYAPEPSADAVVLADDAVSETSEQAAEAPPAASNVLLTDDEEAPAAGVSDLLLAMAALASVLGVALLLAGDSTVASTARVVLVTVAAAALIAEAWLGARDASELHPAAELCAPMASVIAAIVALSTSDPRTNEAIFLAGVIVTSNATSTWLLRKARRPLDLARERLHLALDGDCSRVVGDDLAEARAIDLRPGEELLVESGETVLADATITAGSATVLPWLGAKSTASLREGDVVVAGARVVEGRLRAVVGWAGLDRAWMRLTRDPRRRADLASALARFGRIWVERIAPLGALLAALFAFVSDSDLIAILLLAAAVQAALGHPALGAVGALRVGGGILDALGRGVAFRTAEGFDRAGRASTAVFCARGTLLLGEPEVANVEALAGTEPEQVLALVAGAESGAGHPVATAVARAARARSIRPDGVRSPIVQPGLGVTAVASNGQALIVGSRALMLKEHVSIAIAENTITDLEATGRTVLLVALGGRLIGVVGLQDGLRPGARAAVQHLLDVGLEPVLLSGDSRETCEALGRTLDIDHIRPEVPPAERADEVKRLSEGGAVVAVVGRSPSDDGALSAGDVAVALGAAGSTSAEWAVQLASDDVRDAAYAMRIANDCRRETRIDLVLVLGPALSLSALALLGLAPVAAAPLGTMAGALLALLRASRRP
ncbi:MAG TPA: HAD family hydrolase [Polyangiaceae bacterium]|nr:HAD family hydrolase [Polyangiaceae bacterium]